MTGTASNHLVPEQNTPEVWIADTSNPLPSSFAADLAAEGYTSLGYLDSAPEFASEADETTYIPWNSPDPTHTCLTNKVKTVALRLAETTRETVEMCFGTGTWTVAFGGVRFVPSGAAYPPKRLVYRVIDDTGAIFLSVYSVVQVSSVDEILTQDDKCSTMFWGVTFKQMAPMPGEPAWQLLSTLPQLVTP